MLYVASVIYLSALAHGGYIVTLKSQDRADGTAAHMEKVEALFARERSLDQNRIDHVFDSAFAGYSAQFSESVAAKVRAMPEVLAVEEDQVASATAVQRDAPWGLARLSSPRCLVGNLQNPGYAYDANGGQGVDVFVIDTGINVDHPEFQGRAVWGANFIDGSPDTDENGHGTHCAGTVASQAFGVAKGATVVAVKVLDARGQGMNSQIIAGIEWAIKNRRSGRGSVMNLSLGSGRSEATNRAVRAATQAGFFVAVAAGNDNVDACTVSPASEPSVVTVGATNIQDARASFSNWGQCLDLFAPGENILSTWNLAYSNQLSGTSMASPHVAGLAAYLMTVSGNTSPAYIADLMRSQSQKNALSNLDASSPNLLISNRGQ